MKRTIILILTLTLLPVFAASQALAQQEDGKRQIRVLRPTTPGAVKPLEIVPDAAEVNEISSVQVGDRYRQAFRAVGGHGYGFIWDHGLLPAGLTMRMDSTREGRVFITGYPEDEGVFEITISAKDVSDPSMSVDYSFTLEVAPAVLQ